MSTAIAKNFQIGADSTPTNNFTLYQPASPDGTVRLGNGNTGTTSSLLTLTSAGSLNFGGTAVRITGDFSNATVANSVAFQSSTVNGFTLLNTLPNGTGNISGVRFFSSTDPGNSSLFQIIQSGVDSGLYATKNGTGSFGPMTFFTSDAERVRIGADGNLGIGTSSPINLLTVQTAATGTTAGSNIIARFQSNAAGRDATLQFSDNVANSATISMVGGAVAVAQNGVERTRIDTSGNFQFNSGYGSVATAYGCRAWVNFNGTGTVAIRASGNVSSITDNGTGNYTVNFTTAMPDASFTPVMNAGDGGTAGAGACAIYTQATGSQRVFTFNTAGSAQDYAVVSVAIFR